MLELPLQLFTDRYHGFILAQRERRRTTNSERLGEFVPLTSRAMLRLWTASSSCQAAPRTLEL
jgi:hypothetical protein